MTTTTTTNPATTSTNVAVETEQKPVFRAGTTRAVALELFLAALPKLKEMGNTAFRKHVLNEMQEKQKITLASAAATYNIIKKYAVAEELCEDFGRTPAAKKPAKDKAEKASKASETAKTDEALVNVMRSKDSKVVAEGVTQAEAEELIAKAVKGKKAKLVIA